jgi:predicted ester cyclase
MSTELNRAVFRRYCDELIGQKAFDKLEEIIDPEIVAHLPMPDMPAGLDGIREELRLLQVSFPDQTLRIEDMIAEGDQVAARCVNSGTHTGAAFFGIPPSGRRFEMEEILITRYRDGRIVEMWAQVDQRAMPDQLGSPVA